MLQYEIKNKKLYELLSNVGVKFENVMEGEFSSNMRIVLPSGEQLSGDESIYSYFYDFKSISAWIMAELLMVEEVDQIVDIMRDDDEYDGGTILSLSKKLLCLLNDSKLISWNWNEISEWSKIDLISKLENSFGEFDKEIKDSYIEQVEGFDGEVYGSYMKIHDGKRLYTRYSNNGSYNDFEKEKGKGMKFSVEEKLERFENFHQVKEAIEKIGGVLVENVSEKTDYLICNDLESQSKNMKNAKELGVTVLSEVAFIRRFCDVRDFKEIKDENEVNEEAWTNIKWGGVLEYVMENGTNPITMEILKNGNWIKAKS